MSVCVWGGAYLRQFLTYNRSLGDLPIHITPLLKFGRLTPRLTMLTRIFLCLGCFIMIFISPEG